MGKIKINNDLLDLYVKKSDYTELETELKQIIAENEQLKAELEKEKTLKDMYFTYYKAKHNDVEGELFQLKSECERLKRLLETKCQSEWEKENAELKAENEHYRKEAYRLADGLNKTENLAFTYKQALQEIREIVEGCHYGDCHECKYKPADDCRTQLIVNVIAKINSVIGAE